MTVDELNIAPRTRGRGTSPLQVEFHRELTQSDLALLASERGIKPTQLTRIRDRHHALARCLASGMSNTEASAVTGYDPSRISILLSDPTFKELLQGYRSIEQGLLADFTERATTLTLTVMENLQEKAENGDLSSSEELEILKATADRTGHAPVQKNLNLNVNAELGNRLAAARRRLETATRTEVVTVVPTGEPNGDS